MPDAIDEGLAIDTAVTELGFGVWEGKPFHAATVQHQVDFLTRTFTTVAQPVA